MALTRGFIRNAPTTPLDARLMDMTQIVGNADGSPRPGVMDADGRTIVTALGTMAVAVATADFVTTKGTADGVAIYTNDGTTNVTIAAAPASNSRIDVIWTKHNDNTTGDANSTPIFGVTAGTAAASPVKPAIPSGALELATLRVFAGTTAANGGANVLTNTYQMTASRGGIVPFRTLADLTAWTNALNGQVARDLATGDLYYWNGTIWRVQDGGMRQIIPTSVIGATVDPDGTVRPNQGVTRVQLNGIFSPRYRAYIVEWMLNFASAGGTTLRLCSAGTPYTGTTYIAQRLVVASGAATASASPLSNGWPGAGITGAFISGTYKFKNPSHVSPKFLESDVTQAPGTGYATDRGWVGSQDSTLFDGFEFTCSGAGVINAGDATFFKVYGLV